jgi:hypothetical protein
MQETAMNAPRPRRRAAVAVIGLLALLVLVSSCSVIRGTIDLQNDLESAGYSSPKISTNQTNGVTTVTVRANGGPGTQKAAEVVWTQFKFKVDYVDVFVSGYRSASYGRAEMRSRFGPRPAGYDDEEIGTAIGRAAAITFGIIFGVYFLAMAIALIVVAIQQSNKKKRRMALGYGPGMWPPEQRPLPGWAQPQQWQQPPPGQWPPQQPPPTQWPPQQPPAGQWQQPPAQPGQWQQPPAQPDQGQQPSPPGGQPGVQWGDPTAEQPQGPGEPPPPGNAPPPD